MKFFMTALLTVGLASGMIGCQKKSSKKGASATPNTTTTTPSTTTPVTPAPSTTVPNTVITGLNCPMNGLLRSGETKNVVIDTTNKRMTITATVSAGTTGTSGTQEYTLIPEKSLILTPNTPRYTVTPVSGQTSDKGTLNIYNLDEAQPTILLTSVPFSFGDGKSIMLGRATCTK